MTSESWPSRRVGAVYTDDWRVEFSMRVHFGTVVRNMLVPQGAVGPGSPLPTATAIIQELVMNVPSRPSTVTALFVSDSQLAAVFQHLLWVLRTNTRVDHRCAFDSSRPQPRIELTPSRRSLDLDLCHASMHWRAISLSSPSLCLCLRVGFGILQLGPRRDAQVHHRVCPISHFPFGFCTTLINSLVAFSLSASIKTLLCPNPL